MSYLLRRKWRGQGVASEAASLLLRTTAEHLPDQVVLVVTQTANAPSLTIAERLGFQIVGTFVEFDADQWLGAGQLHELARASPRRLSLKTTAFSARSRNPRGRSVGR
ncbi:GNAT family N-acetyltransferase [Brachybacterium alimentarium]|uniref:GNAT family N-acetyltransferase n=1 Tax=Brachybacterium alimentarium TaxID=47845 RepID=UPI000DF34E8C|nr:N-acetyltransferase [Brachybacterium alimentarium]